MPILKDLVQNRDLCAKAWAQNHFLYYIDVQGISSTF